MITFNFDVLARPGTELASRLPDPDGIRLWHMLHEQTMGRLAVVVDQDVDRSIFEHWLKVNGIKATLYDILDTDDPAVKAEKVHRILMAMGRSDWYIDSNPDTCAETLRLGIPTLMYANPYVVRPEWSNSTSTPRSWDSLVQEVDRQTELRMSRTWGDGPVNYGDD